MTNTLLTVAVKDRIAAAHGSQCGFCTPGMVMSMYTLLRNSPSPSLRQIEGAFEGKREGVLKVRERAFLKER